MILASIGNRMFVMNDKAPNAKTFSASSIFCFNKICELPF
jgi:hypothetical protein